MALEVNNKTTIYGDKLHIYYGGKPIAFGTSCSLEISAETLDTSNKMSGNWKEYLTGQLSYTLNSESLLTYSADAEGAGLENVATFTDLLSAMVAREPVEFVMGTSKAAEDNFALNSKFVSGKAIITGLSATAQTGQITTCTVTFQGSGELTPSDVFDDVVDAAE